MPSLTREQAEVIWQTLQKPEMRVKHVPAPVQERRITRGAQVYIIRPAALREEKGANES